MYSHLLPDRDLAIVVLFHCLGPDDADEPAVRAQIDLLALPMDGIRTDESELVAQHLDRA